MPCVIPYAPRPLQRRFHEERTRFCVLLCHRRFGKTVAAVNPGQRVQERVDFLDLAHHVHALVRHGRGVERVGEEAEAALQPGEQLPLPRAPARGHQRNRPSVGSCPRRSS